ncbi:hypothetical protein C4D60_Mb04t03310 [Musa balbisiana]|uniref:Uncharacterized protein n=1 Tax=Musa balbisiana TaxID=52838 RepID=A0A4S8K9E7_MUSBA|nr:hypothetical protein C4D60_Mb04t03310 [Musa balbisiana]
MPLTGATIVDRYVNVTPVKKYKLPPEAYRHKLDRIRHLPMQQWRRQRMWFVACWPRALFSVGTHSSERNPLTSSTNFYPLMNMHKFTSRSPQ